MKIFFLGCIRLYQVLISPFLPQACRFTPTCSHYAGECLHKFSIFRALWYTFKRLLRCHPWHDGGFDPIPEK